MSNFWAVALGTPPASAPVAAPSTRPSLAGYAPSPYFTPVEVPVSPVAAPEDLTGQTVAEVLASAAAGPTRALSAKSSQSCPDCNSGNYFKPHGMPNAMAQCYDCGHNDRFAQSTQGGGLPSDSSAPTRASKQLNPKGVSNFNPHTYDPKQGGAGHL